MNKTGQKERESQEIRSDIISTDAHQLLQGLVSQKSEAELRAASDDTSGTSLV